MACKVFGSPVMDENVRKIHPNVSKITSKHRAEAALLCMNADENVEKVKGFLQELMAAQVSPKTTTLGMFYNATGHDMTFILTHNWKGLVLKPYPEVIQNGQWAVFSHVGLTSCSKAAVVYSGINFHGTTCDWMLAWNTTEGDSQNHVYTEIREHDHYKTVDWKYVDSMMEKKTNDCCDSWNGCFSAITIEKGDSPTLKAIMTLEALSPNSMAMARDVSKCLNLK